MMAAVRSRPALRAPSPRARVIETAILGHEHVDAAGRLGKWRMELEVAGDENRPPLVVEPIGIRRRYRRVVHFHRNDLQGRTRPGELDGHLPGRDGEVLEDLVDRFVDKTWCRGWE
jgi:hypothetical protein